MVTIQAVYEGDLHCVATHGPSGTALSTDAPKDNQGLGESFSPTDLLATGLMTCVMTIMGIAARKDGLDLAGMKGKVVKHMVADPTRRIGGLDLEITMPAGLNSGSRKMLEEIASTCPVCYSLSPKIDVKVSFSYLD
ncbi:MAG: OsmC family protein [Planctomycetota bacterium]|jgi:putative redox protein